MSQANRGRERQQQVAGKLDKQKYSSARGRKRVANAIELALSLLLLLLLLPATLGRCYPLRSWWVSDDLMLIAINQTVAAA